MAAGPAGAAAPERVIMIVADVAEAIATSHSRHSVVTLSPEWNLISVTGRPGPASAAAAAGAPGQPQCGALIDNGTSKSGQANNYVGNHRWYRRLGVLTHPGRVPARFRRRGVRLGIDPADQTI